VCAAPIHPLLLPSGNVIGGSKLDEPKPEVPGKAVHIVGLKIADPAVVVFDLALQEKVWLGGRRRIVVCGRVLVLERYLKVEIVEVADRYVASVELHEWDHLHQRRRQTGAEDILSHGRN
jgi:hypothetical protein